MRVLLVYPCPPRTFWSFDGALELVGCRVLLPPLGLITVAALVPSHWQLRLVDTQIRPVREDEWAWAELVILSGMIVHKRDLARQIELARSWQVPVAVGGPFASSTPDAPELAGADYLILDEGEVTIPQFVAAVEAGVAGGRFSAAGEKPDLTTSPVPRFDLLDLDAYDTMAVQFSRGCPFQCEFCDIIVLYGRKPRTEASLDMAADGPLMVAMVACRFRRVFLGIETPDTGSLVGAGKLQNTRAPLEEAVDTITSHGLQVMAGFILGFDGEASGAGGRIVDFVAATAIPVAMVGVLQALPNTALWQRLAREGRLLSGDDRFDAGVQTHLLNFVPTRPIGEIAAEFLEAFDRLYDPRAYLERVFAYCRKLPPTPKGQLWRPWHLARRLRALAILVWRQGVQRQTRWPFWHHLAVMLLSRPALLEDYLWMLALEEHFLAYRSEVNQQVNDQLDAMAPPAMAQHLPQPEPELSGLRGVPLPTPAGQG